MSLSASAHNGVSVMAGNVGEEWALPPYTIQYGGEMTNAEHRISTPRAFILLACIDCWYFNNSIAFQTLLACSNTTWIAVSVTFAIDAAYIIYKCGLWGMKSAWNGHHLALLFFWAFQRRADHVLVSAGSHTFWGCLFKCYLLFSGTMYQFCVCLEALLKPYAASCRLLNLNLESVHKTAQGQLKLSWLS